MLSFQDHAAQGDFQDVQLSAVILPLLDELKYHSALAFIYETFHGGKTLQWKLTKYNVIKFTIVFQRIGWYRNDALQV